MMTIRWQYQAKAQPPSDPEPDFGWFSQPPEPHASRSVRSLIPEGFYARGLDSTEISPDFGWFTQEPDVIRPRHQTRPGLFALGQPVILAPTDFEWFAQEPALARTREPKVCLSSANRHALHRLVGSSRSRMLYVHGTKLTPATSRWLDIQLKSFSTLIGLLRSLHLLEHVSR